MEIKSLNISEKKFTANGKNYFIHDKISIDRYMEYEKIMPQLTFGIGFNEQLKNLRQIYDLLNKQKFADASVITHNMMNGIADVQKKERVHPALKMAAMFINREGEDLSVYDEQVTLSKIEDWTKEGYAINDFFTLALNSINGFKEAFQEYMAQNPIND